MGSKKNIVNKKIVVQAIIDKVENEQSDVKIKTSVVEGYDKPDKIQRKGDHQEGYTPDVILESSKHKELYEVELDQDFELDKWKLFSLYSSKQSGNFNIVAPEEYLPEVREALKTNNINAKIIYFT